MLLDVVDVEDEDVVAEAMSVVEVLVQDLEVLFVLIDAVSFMEEQGIDEVVGVVRRTSSTLWAAAGGRKHIANPCLTRTGNSLCRQKDCATGPSRAESKFRPENLPSHRSSRPY